MMHAECRWSRRSDALNVDVDHPLADMLSAEEDKYCLVRRDTAMLFFTNRATQMSNWFSVLLLDVLVLSKVSNLWLQRMGVVRRRFAFFRTSSTWDSGLIIQLSQSFLLFSEAEDYKPIQTLILTPKDLETDSLYIPVDFARFVRTDVLTVSKLFFSGLIYLFQIFVESNQGDEEQTRIDRLVIFGKTSA